MRISWCDSSHFSVLLFQNNNSNENQYSSNENVISSADVDLPLADELGTLTEKWPCILSDAAATQTTFPRNCFNRPRRVFPSSLRRRDALLGRVAIRLRGTSIA